MKILHLLASPFFTGPAEVVMQLALAQREWGHDVTIAVDRKRTTHTSEELIVPRLEPLGLLSDIDLELSVKSNPWAMWRDVLMLRSLTVDVVHAHFSHDHALARLGRPAGARLFRSLHAPRSVRWSLAKADGYTVPMESLLRKLLGHRVLVLPPAVGSQFCPSSNREALRSELNLPSGFLVGMVSAFQPARRHELGLRAFASLRTQNKKASLLLVGDGPLESTLKKSAGEDVSFVGYQAGEAFISHLQALDEVWILGLGNDWSARAAAQARACGVRVVAVNEGALSRYADAIVEPTVESVLAGSTNGQCREMTLESSADIARRVLAFYSGVP